jgi:hypothetical protein
VLGDVSEVGGLGRAKSEKRESGKAKKKTRRHWALGKDKSGSGGKRAGRRELGGGLSSLVRLAKGGGVTEQGGPGEAPFAEST